MSAPTKKYYDLASREFAFRLKQHPGTWFPDFKQDQGWPTSRATYIRTGKWSPGPGFSAVVVDGKVLVRWVGP